MEIREMTEEEEKSRICGEILHALPCWFGIEQSILEYMEEVRALPFYTVWEDGCAAGFLAVKPQTEAAAEVCVMGVRQEFHRRGIGRALLARAEAFCRVTGRQFLTVKTLDASANCEPYARTRAFYRSMGFVPLEVFPTLWDEWNPCLLMVKPL